jgi:WD40 repeat protein
MPGEKLVMGEVVMLRDLLLSRNTGVEPHLRLARQECLAHQAPSPFSYSYFGLCILLACTLRAVVAIPSRAELNARPAVTALVAAPDGKLLLQASQAGVVVRPMQGEEETTLSTKLDHVLALAFDQTGSRLAVAGGSPGEAGAVEIWSWPERKLLGKLEGHEDVVTDVVWLAGGKSLATSSADRTVRTWDGATFRNQAVLKGHSGPVLALAISPDGKWLCSGSADQTIRVWNPATGQLARSLDNHLGAVGALAFRPGGIEGQPAYLASASEDGTVRIWQPAVGRMVRIVRLGTPVHCLAWSKTGDRLHVGGKDGVVRTVDADSDQVLQERKITDGRLTSLLTGPIAGTSRGEVVFPPK